jgi:hypothetical protein
MDNRHHPRVQCFQISQEHDLKPVWVFRMASANGVLGLIVDVSMGGLQVLTDKNEEMRLSDYRLIVHDDLSENGELCALDVVCRWSRAEGALYFRSGFEYSDAPNATGAVEALRARVASGHKWMRCELDPH